MTWHLNAGVKKPSKRAITNRASILALIALVKGDLGYNAEGKAEFHRLGRGILQGLANALGLQKDTYEVRSNMGGIAVSGEITLHGEHLYVQLSQSCLGHNFGFMWRTCSGRKDYSGHSNQWAKFDELLDLGKLAEKMKAAVAKINPPYVEPFTV